MMKAVLRYSSAFSALIFALSSCVNQSRPIQESPAIEGIIYDSNRLGLTFLYRFDAAGIDVPLKVSSNEPWARAPDWSPDRSKIVFQGSYDEMPALWALELLTERRWLLASGPISLGSPAWSPDGKLIAFTSQLEDSMRIEVVDSTGLNRRVLIEASSGGASWSPDGEEVAFLSLQENVWNVFVADIDGSNHRQLTRFGEGAGGPSWSPDGHRIAFDSPADGDWDVYTVKPDGSELRKITSSASSDARPSWSCDGRWIVFHSDRDFTDGELENPYNGLEIYIIRPDGTDVRRLTKNESMDAHPDWC